MELSTQQLMDDQSGVGGRGGGGTHISISLDCGSDLLGSRGDGKLSFALEAFI